MSLFALSYERATARGIHTEEDACSPHVYWCLPKALFACLIALDV